MGDVFRRTIRGKKSKYYYGKLRDPKTKQWSRVPLQVSDKQVARQKLRELQQRAERVAAGMVDPLAETPLVNHLAAFMKHLEQQGRGETYRLQTECEIIKVAMACAGLKVPGRIDRTKLDEYRDRIGRVALDVVTVDAVDGFLASIPSDRAARTKNGYRTSIIGLFSFVGEKRRLPYNPLLATTRSEGAAKRKRRALSVEQLQSLLDAARARPLAMSTTIRRGARKGEPAKLAEDCRRVRERDGAERALIYQTAFLTGLRRKELRALRVKHLNLTGDLPNIYLLGEDTKNGQDARLPINAGFAAQLAAWVDGRGPDDPVFNIPLYDELLKSLKKDLAYAGIPYRDELGRYCDFHSLRKSLGTHLRRAKVDPAVSQQFMRHSDIRLTMETYNDDRLHDLNQEVVSKLPTFTG